MARRRSSGERWLWIWSGVLAAAFGASWLAFQAERKLSSLVVGGLGESFSTRIWSAPFILKDGARGEAERFVSRLERLGYRRVDGPPLKGEYRWTPPELTV